MSEYYVSTATIANAASLSDAIDLSGASFGLREACALVGIIMPATWTAASMTFSASDDNTTFRDLYDSAGTEITYTVAASHHIRVTPSDWAGMQYLKVRSGTAGAAVAQGGARLIKLVFREV